MAEKYEPTPEEMKNAEDMMNSAEKEATEWRENGPKLTPEEIELAKKCNLKHGNDGVISGTINGHRVEFGADSRGKSFTYIDGIKLDILTDDEKNGLYNKYFKIALQQGNETEHVSKAKTERREINDNISRQQEAQKAGSVVRELLDL